RWRRVRRRSRPRLQGRRRAQRPRALGDAPRNIGAGLPDRVRRRRQAVRRGHDGLGRRQPARRAGRHHAGNLPAEPRARAVRVRAAEPLSGKQPAGARRRPGARAPCSGGALRAYGPRGRMPLHLRSPRSVGTVTETSLPARAQAMPTPVQYLDKAMTRLRDLGLVPEKTEEAPIVALLNRITNLDGAKVVAIVRTLSQTSLFNQVVREQMSAMQI